jgi:phosphoribosylamine--glycine ligase
MGSSGQERNEAGVDRQRSADLSLRGKQRMKILVIGGGGREHALVWRLRQSPQVTKIWCAPGNGGIAADAECLPADLQNVSALAELGERLRPDLTVVGPEQPLVLGVADEFAKRGLTIVGPSRQAAELEGSKVFAKRFMERHGIPTATLYGIYDSAVDAYTALCAVDWPVVVKADGLASGKGVLVTSSPDEATSFIERLMERREFGAGGKQILLEEGLEGEELSYIVLTDGEHILPMLPTRDHKRAYDGDAGPNTGGMGAYSSDELLGNELERAITQTIVRPTISALAAEGRPYRGFLYFGLMLTDVGPKVLEFNCRLGDPETQAIVPRIDFDLPEVLFAAAVAKLRTAKAAWKPGAAACVVLASEGYPGAPRIGREISGLQEAGALPGVAIFHAGTKRDGSDYYTSGGRVLGIACRDLSLDEACGHVYDAVSRVHFNGCHYRTDIGRARKARSVQGRVHG